MGVPDHDTRVVLAVLAKLRQQTRAEAQKHERTKLRLRALQETLRNIRAEVRVMKVAPKDALRKRKLVSLCTIALRKPRYE